MCTPRSPRPTSPPRSAWPASSNCGRHAVLGPLLEAIDDAHDRGESAPTARADLAVRLQEHLTHEKEAALPVIDSTLDDEQWMQSARRPPGGSAPTCPGSCHGCWTAVDAQRTQAVLGGLPEPAQQDYRNEWQPTYAANDW
jgi:hypothetical protein